MAGGLRLLGPSRSPDCQPRANGPVVGLRGVRCPGAVPGIADLVASRVLEYRGRTGDAAPAVVTGLADFVAHVSRPPPGATGCGPHDFDAQRPGAFGLSLVVRHSPEFSDWSLRLVPMAIDCLGTLLLAAGGWFGGELVYGHAVGVRQG